MTTRALLFPWHELKIISCLSLLILITSCSQPEDSENTASQLIEGQPFPHLVLTTLDGKKVAFNPQQNKVIVFNAWGTWCPPCRKEMPALQRLNEKLNPAHYSLILMAMDTDPLIVREYMIDKKLKLTSYIDQDLKITEDIFGLKIYPTTFLIDKNGILRHTITGEKEWDSPDVLKTLQKISEIPNNESIND